MSVRTQLAVGIAMAVIAGSSAAATRTIYAQTNGAGACQAALPNYEGQIRKRPLAIQNEGSAGAFITCSPVSLQGNELHGTGHELVLVNNAGAPATVNCTGVSGASYMPKSAQVPGNGGASISWMEADGVDGLNFDTMNVSCLVPPGIGIRTIYTRQIVDIGE